MSNYYEGIPFGSKTGRIRRKGRSPLPLLAALLVAFVVLYGLFQMISGFLGGIIEPSTAPTPTTQAAVIVPVPTPVPAQVTPTSAPPPTPAPSPTARPTATAPAVLQVSNTGGVGVYIRRAPSGDERLRAWVEGTRMTVIGADQAVDGITWRHVRDPLGNEGWVPAQYLAPAPADPAATPTRAAG